MNFKQDSLDSLGTEFRKEIEDPWLCNMPEDDCLISQAYDVYVNQSEQLALKDQTLSNSSATEQDIQATKKYSDCEAGPSNIRPNKRKTENNATYVPHRMLRSKDSKTSKRNNIFNEHDVSVESDTESLFGGDFSDDDPLYRSENVQAAPECDSDDSELITLQELLNPDYSYEEEESKKVQRRKGIALVFNKDKSESHQTAEFIMLEIVQRCWKIIKPRARWRQPDIGSWKINVAKKRRTDGLPYTTKNKRRDAKLPKAIDCSKCSYKCSDHINEIERQVLCRKYWSHDFAGKKSFILAHVSVKPTKRILKDRKRPTERSYVKQCFFVINGERINICQKFFCKTLCISPSAVADAIMKRDAFGCYSMTQDPRGRKEPPNKTAPKKVEDVKRHITSFPTMESHYLRKQSKRKYLDAGLSLPKMYGLYVQECKNKNATPVSDMTYRRIFSTQFNLGYFVPKKDQCLICTKFKRENSEEKVKLLEEYQAHIERKQKCNSEKNKDKQRAEDDANFLSATFDLQAILQVPSTEVGLLYYTRKLTIYNLTLYESALPNEAYCFVWSEIHGKKGSAEIGTILWHYLTNCLPERVTEVSLFSDTCGGQNRNQFVAAILLWTIHHNEQLQVIEHKFLESGHSYMEADSMHSAIETAKKYRDVYCVSDWINIFKEARSKEVYKKGNKYVKKARYNVKEFKYSDFKDLKKIADTIILNKTMNTDGQKVQWLKIKRMKYVKGDRNIYYNYDMSPSIFMTMDVTGSGTETSIDTAVTTSGHRSHGYATRGKLRQQEAVDEPSTSSTSPEFVFPPLQQLYLNPLPISEAKKKDLVNLCMKGVIPEEYQGWYKSLATDTNRIDRVPDVTASDTDSSESDT